MHSINAQLMKYGYKPQYYILHTLPILFSFRTAVNNNVVCVQIFETVATLAPSSCCEIIYGNTVHHVNTRNFHSGNIFVECNVTIW